MHCKLVMCDLIDCYKGTNNYRKEINRDKLQEPIVSITSLFSRVEVSKDHEVGEGHFQDLEEYYFELFVFLFGFDKPLQKSRR